VGWLVCCVLRAGSWSVVGCELGCTAAAVPSCPGCVVPGGVVAGAVPCAGADGCPGAVVAFVSVPPTLLVNALSALRSPLARPDRVVALPWWVGCSASAAAVTIALTKAQRETSRPVCFARRASLVFPAVMGGSWRREGRRRAGR